MLPEMFPAMNFRTIMTALDAIENPAASFFSVELIIKNIMSFLAKNVK